MSSKEVNSNFIPINRKLFDHEFWEENREFSKFEAWLDLIQTARYEKGAKTEWIKGRQITYSRGEVPASIRYLQSRWNWGSITKVEKFLTVLEKEDMIVIKKGQGQSVITICKYDTYNPLKNTERTSKGQSGGQQKDESNKERKKEYIDSVFLLESEYENLCSDFSKKTTDEAIKYLSNWGKEKPKKFSEYKDHNLTIRRWVINAVTKDSPSPTLFSSSQVIIPN